MFLKLIEDSNIADNAAIICLLNPDKISKNKYFSNEIKSLIENQLHQGIKSQTHFFQGNYYFLEFLSPEKNEFKHLENFRTKASKTLEKINALKIETVRFLDADFGKLEMLAFAEGMALSNYKFLKYFTKPESKENSLKEIRLSNKQAEKKEINALNHLIEANFITRNLVNEPLNYLSAEKLSEEIHQLSKNAGFNFEYFTRKKIESLKMGGLLAVNAGSKNTPTFNILEWKPKKAKNKKPIILVGKGVVFDTGGVNIKTMMMELMKSDMAGGAAVVGTIYALAKNEIPVHVIGLIPATDNRTGDNAFVPSDIIKISDGTTVEVLNTDAEGRLILADALVYAKKFNPELVIDLATLTGAAMRAIGHLGMVGMGNLEGRAKENLLLAGNKVYERIADLPFWDEYGEQIKSEIADIKNLGGANAGAQTAGKFLEYFTDYPWYHLDIAPNAFIETNDSYRGKGATGTGVRLLYTFIKDYINE